MKRICGFTRKEIDAATCYLTPSGLNKMHPCESARKAGYYQTEKIDVNWTKRWQAKGKLIEAWLCGSNDWTPWEDRSVHWHNALTDAHCLELTRRLKAYIMKYGRRGR